MCDGMMDLRSSLRLWNASLSRLRRTSGMQAKYNTFPWPGFKRLRLRRGMRDDFFARHSGFRGGRGARCLSHTGIVVDGWLESPRARCVVADRPDISGVPARGRGACLDHVVVA